MRVFLIRHGETVDNVAQLYAGSRDSELTNHGVNQATRLGQHFSSTNVKLTHIFSSHLKRAFKTAQLIREAQDGPPVVQSQLIKEQDFGSNEGKSWTTRATLDPEIKDEPLIPSETRESMEARIDEFLDTLFEPVMSSSPSVDPAIAIVSHGIVLGVLWRRILRRLPPQSVTLSPEIITTNSMIVLEHLGRWGNTCYLELTLAVNPDVLETHSPGAASATDAATEPLPRDLETGSIFDSSVPLAHSPLHAYLTTIERVNARDHLKSLKRTGGGVGSAKYDASQRGIESFFKKPRNG